MSQFSGDLREMAEAAANDIDPLTVLQHLLLDSQRSQYILETRQPDMEEQFVIDYARDIKVDSYLSYCSALENPFRH